MALIQEDGTGRPDAQCYVAAAAFAAYCARFGRDLSSFDADAISAAQAAAFQFVNTSRCYKSAPLANEQAGEFPRIDLSDGMGRILNTVPQRVKDAECELAWIALSEALYSNVDRGGQITAESIGQISTTYAPGAPAQKLFTAADNLLKVFARDGASPRQPVPGFDMPITAPTFGIGMNDFDPIDTCGPF